METNDVRLETREKPWIVLLFLSLVLYVIFLGAFGRFSATDEIAFKAAGREWAATGRFAAPEMAGFLSLSPPVEKVWFAQLPLYTFLFGLFVRMFRFGPLQTVLFDALIHCALCLLTYVVARNMGERRNRKIAVIAALLVLPFGTPARPDELAMCFGMVGLSFVMSRRGEVMAAAACGAAMGLSSATSLVAGGVFAATACGFALNDSRQWKQPILCCVIGIAAAVTMFSICTVPFLALDPGAYRQFLTHSSHQFRDGLVSGTRFAWKYGQRYLWIAVGALAACWYSWRRKNSDWARLWAVPALILVAMRIILPQKYLYVWFLGPWFVAATVVVFHRSLRENRRPWGVWVAWIVCYLGAVLPPIRDALIMASLPATQKLSFNVDLIHRFIPRGSRVLGSEFWPSLGNDYRFYSETFADPRLQDIDYILLTGNGSGQPGKPAALRADLAKGMEGNFVVVQNNLNRQPFKVMGLKLSHSAWGFGCVVLRRKSLAELRDSASVTFGSPSP